MGDHPRDCPHGRQWGKCDTCEMLAAHELIAGLEATVEAKSRTIETLVKERRAYRKRAEQAEAALEIERERPCATCGDVNRAEEGGRE